MIRITLTAAALALSSLVAPAHTEGIYGSNIEYGNISYTNPLMSINYVQSWDEPAEYALAITAKNSIKANNGQRQSTALLVNCKSGLYSVSFGYKIEKSIEEAVEVLAINFCNFHKKSFAHTLW